jgi:hypothetical protein
MKEAVMLTAERVDDIEIALLEALPPFSACAPEDLEVLVANDVMRMRCRAGDVLCSLAEDYNLYVLVSGLAELRVGPDLSIELEPGDYFGRQAPRYNRMAGTVVAVTDVEVLVIGPQDMGRLTLDGAGRAGRTVGRGHAGPRGHAGRTRRAVRTGRTGP